MGNLADFLATVVVSSVGTGLALVAFGYLLRTQISHLLLKNLESIKAKHQQHLEAYKVGLIAQAEHAKSLQAIKTAKALRIAELQFAALERLQRILVPHASRASAFMRATSSPEKFQETFG